MTTDDRRRVIGKVVAVTADRLTIEMHAGTDSFTVVGFDNVHYVAALGSYLLVPVRDDYVVVEVVGLRERETSNSSDEVNDIDKASSAKFLDVVPVGMLPQDMNSRFRFGVSGYPSLFSDALYAHDLELDRIFETEGTSEPVTGPAGQEPDVPNATRFSSLPIGKSVVFENYDIKIRVDDFFGAHAAILGNTGSGKSCTLATILQALFTKADEYHARGATFIILDVNGEYEAAFSNLGKGGTIGVRRLILDGTSASNRFRIPHWFLDRSEWELLLQASERTQLPVLRTALGFTSLFSRPEAERVALTEHIIATCIIECYQGSSGDSPVSKYQRVLSILRRYGTERVNERLLQQHGANSQFGNFQGEGQANFLMFLDSCKIENVKLPVYENRPFSFSDLDDCVDLALLYEEAHGNRQIRDYCSQMRIRLKSLADRAEYSFLRHEIVDNKSVIPDQTIFISDLLGLRIEKDCVRKANQLLILDMNAVEDEIVELVSAVIARMTFGILRRAEPRNGFPVHFVLEEAHRYISAMPSRYAVDAAKIFERIAKEGRKYGMFLIVASQRPSELSKTVLSQCSNFLIHRILNPDDLSQIRQMTPFVSDNTIRRLPSLPKQHALVFGTSVNLPMTVRIREASPAPLSHDAKIRELWFHSESWEMGTSLFPGMDRRDSASEDTVPTVDS